MWRQDSVIVSIPKPFEEVLAWLKGEQNLFIVGCGLCATNCQSGGERQGAAMQQQLENCGKQVVGSTVLEVACNAREVKRSLRPHLRSLAAVDGVVVLACGGAVQCIQQTLRDLDLPGLSVHPGCNTIMQGEFRERRFEQHCSLCGQCRLECTGGICVTTRCAKGLQNGPCGGTKDGHCEVDPERACAWVLVFDRLRELGKQDSLVELTPPRDFRRVGPAKSVPLRKSKP
jgi:Methylene-tetrahydrofolate reductase C terminal.